MARPSCSVSSYVGFRTPASEPAAEVASAATAEVRAASGEFGSASAEVNATGTEVGAAGAQFTAAAEVTRCLGGRRLRCGCLGRGSFRGRNLGRRRRPGPERAWPAFRPGPEPGWPAAGRSPQAASAWQSRCPGRPDRPSDRSIAPPLLSVKLISPSGRTSRGTFPESASPPGRSPVSLRSRRRRIPGSRD